MPVKQEKLPAEAGVSVLAAELADLDRNRLWEVLRRRSGIPGAGKLFLDGKPVGHRTFWTRADADHTPLHAKPRYFAWARDVQAHDRAMFEWLVRMLAAAAPWMGLPGASREAELFYGDYGHTPGGIHREACSNLHLVVTGKKSMSFWSPSWPPPDTRVRRSVAEGTATAEEYLPDLNPTRVTGQALTVTAGPGGGFSWNAGVWHVGSTAGPALALNIASYHRSLNDVQVMPFWDAEPWGPGLATVVPEAWMRSYVRFAAVPGVAIALARVSSLGLRAAPARRSQPRAVAVRRTHPVPGLVCRHRGRALAAAMGEVRTLPSTLVPWLTSPWPHGDVRAVPPDCRVAAAWLCGQGALECVETR